MSATDVKGTERAAPLPIGAVLHRAEERHEQLKSQLDVFCSGPRTDKRELARFEAEVLAFFGELKPQVQRMQTTAQFEFLAHIADEWQTLMTTRLRRPIDVWAEIGLELPTRQLKPYRRRLTRQEVRERLEGGARDVSFSRKLIHLYNQIDYLNWLAERPELLHHKGSTQDERDNDWYVSRLMLASDVVTGRIRLEDQLPVESFTELSSCWLQDVKRVLAYFRWMEESHRTAAQLNADAPPTNDTLMYYAVCDQLHESLLDESRKAHCDSFEVIAEWINREFLDNGKLRTDEHSLAQAGVAQKAFRIWQQTGSEDGDANWLEATRFCRSFYENIIPAVVDSAPDRADVVIQALCPTCPPGDVPELVDALEAAIAIEYLPTSLLRQCTLPDSRYL